MNPKLEIALFGILSLVLTGLLCYLIYVAWKQDVNAARQILLATTIVVGLGAITAVIFTVLKSVTLVKNQQEAQMLQSMSQPGGYAPSS